MLARRTNITEDKIVLISMSRSYWYGGVINGTTAGLGYLELEVSWNWLRNSSFGQSASVRTDDFHEEE